MTYCIAIVISELDAAHNSSITGYGALSFGWSLEHKCWVSYCYDANPHCAWFHLLAEYAPSILIWPVEQFVCLCASSLVQTYWTGMVWTDNSYSLTYDEIIFYVDDITVYYVIKCTSPMCLDIMLKDVIYYIRNKPVSLVERMISLRWRSLYLSLM